MNKQYRDQKKCSFPIAVMPADVSLPMLHLGAFYINDGSREQ